MAAAASSVILSSSSSSSYLPARSLSELYSLHYSSTNTTPSSSSSSASAASAPSTPTPESALANKSTKFYGWIRRIRSGDAGNVVFIDVYDGTYVGDFKGVAAKASYQGESFIDPDSTDDLAVQDVKEFKILPYDDLTRAEKLSDGCAVVLDGKLVIPEKATQPFEMQVYRVRLIGGVSDPKTYPIQKTSEKQVVTLRNYPFMRLRAQVMQCLFRITSKLEMGIHEFMDNNDVIRIDPNILTTSDCEGAGETFQVLPKMFSKDSKGEEVGVGLTVSSQLPLESGITGFKQVYTAQKSFRAEKSDTIKHLAEFYHIEYEGAFLTLDKLLSFTESMVKYVIRYAFNKCAKDFAFLESKLSATDVKPARELLTELLDKPFIRIKHCDAITLIEKLVKEKFMLPDEKGELKRVKVDKLPRPGEDIGSEHEKLLVKYFGWMSCSEEEKKEKLEKKKEFGAFVFLTHWPIKIKSFYMKQCDDGSGECESFDLLAPRVGELFGGSMREWRFDKLDEEVKRRGMDISPIQWFLDLRKSGSMPHGGWGMGFARFACLVTGAPSVRDVVFLPVYYGHCPY